MSVGSKALRGLGPPTSLPWARCPCRGINGRVLEEGGSQTGAWRPPSTVAAGPASRSASSAQSGPNSAVTQAGQASERPPESG